MAEPIPVRPRVSVVVPCYNYGRFLPACVGSVLSQEGVEVDVLVIDDASPDGSGEVAARLAEGDPRVRAILHTANRGHIATYNEGLERAEGTYVVLLSADDMLTPGSLARSTRLLEAHPEVGFVYGHPEPLHGTEPAPPRTRVRGWSVWPGRDWIAARCRRGTNPVNSPEVVMRTAVHRRIGYYDPALPYSADQELWLRAALVADVGRVNGPDQAWRRMHGANMSQTTFAGALTDFRERARTFEAFLAGAGSGLPEAAALRETVRARLAADALDLVCESLARGAEVDVAPWVEFATGLDRRVRHGAQWRELLIRQDRAGAGRIAQACAGLYRARRDLCGRIAWRRWRWSGL